MLMIDSCLLYLLRSYSSKVEKLKGERPLPEELDEIALSSLLLVSSYFPAIKKKKEICALLARCKSLLSGEHVPGKGLKIPYDWLAADQLPFTAAGALLEKGSPLSQGDLPCFLLSHSQSSVRWYSFNVFWLIKRHVPIELVVPYLFKDIADTLGYVENAIGLARAFYRTDQEFFEAAASFTPERFEDQFRDRLDQVKTRGLLNACGKIFLSFELEIRRRTEDAFLLRKVPSTFREPKQLSMFPKEGL